MKVSKVVMIVVALHVLVIGGIFIFEGCSRTQSNTPEMAANETLPGQQPEALAPGAQSLQPGMIATPQSLAPATAMMPQPIAPAPVETAPPTSRTYVVRKGDSLWKISRAENVSIAELARANNLTKTSTLKIGQKLQVPQMAKTETVATAAASVIPTSSDMTAPVATGDVGGPAYTVKSGDSLWKIARQQGVSVAAIKQANNLSSDMLKIGQKLQIPTAAAAAPAVVTTTTGAADVTTMTAPAPAMSAAIATGSNAGWRDPGTYVENGQTIHIVDFNETPAIIAKKYGIRTDDLLRANNISDPRKIRYGQQLIVPLATQGATTVPAAANTTAPVVTTPALAAPVVSASQVTIQ